MIYKNQKREKKVRKKKNPNQKNPWNSNISEIQVWLDIIKSVSELATLIG